MVASDIYGLVGQLYDIVEQDLWQTGSLSPSGLADEQLIDHLTEAMDILLSHLPKCEFEVVHEGDLINLHAVSSQKLSELIVVSDSKETRILCDYVLRTTVWRKPMAKRTFEDMNAEYEKIRKEMKIVLAKKEIEVMHLNGLRMSNVTGADVRKTKKNIEVLKGDYRSLRIRESDLLDAIIKKINRDLV